ncbi:uncharacterized protein V1518DRAFT_420506 [Limtongia smithiae]|uniref:uncharacterized protein n=1 Tax=Limtongia smithiae TaxID=1125753 RepID=UPI0034CF1DA3
MACLRMRCLARGALRLPHPHLSVPALSAAVIRSHTTYTAPHRTHSQPNTPLYLRRCKSQVATAKKPATPDTAPNNPPSISESELRELLQKQLLENDLDTELPAPTAAELEVARVRAAAAATSAKVKAAAAAKQSATATSTLARLTKIVGDTVSGSGGGGRGTKNTAAKAEARTQAEVQAQTQIAQAQEPAESLAASASDALAQQAQQQASVTASASASVSASASASSPKKKNFNRSAIEDLLLERSLVQKSTQAGNLLRCTVFDLEGNVTVVSGEFKKSELLLKHGLLPRDLRKLDTGTAAPMPSILVRNSSILVNLLHIRALIKADMVLLFDAYGSTDSQTQSVFMYDLEGKLRQGSKAMGGLPYEMRALEAILISVVTALDAEMKVHTTIVAGILADLENDIDREKLRHLLIQSKTLSAFLQKATLVRDAINEVLDQDDDLAAMYLSEKLHGVVRPADMHSEVEMLLESYYKHCDEIVQAASITMSNVRTTEEIVNIILDANRNSLMLLELKFSIGTLGLGGGALVAALYGMNLKNFAEDSTIAFWTVTGAAALIVWLIIGAGLRNLRKVQRVTMMFEDHPSSAIQTRQIYQANRLGVRPLVVVSKKSLRKSNNFWS